jgi:hypothetical protein
VGAWLPRLAEGVTPAAFTWVFTALPVCDLLIEALNTLFLLSRTAMGLPSFRIFSTSVEIVHPLLEVLVEQGWNHTTLQPGRLPPFYAWVTSQFITHMVIMT